MNKRNFSLEMGRLRAGWQQGQLSPLSPLAADSQPLFVSSRGGERASELSALFLQGNSTLMT